MAVHAGTGVPECFRIHVGGARRGGLVRTTKQLVSCNDQLSDSYKGSEYHYLKSGIKKIALPAVLNRSQSEAA